MDPRSPVIVAARRTAVATAGRGLRDVDAAALAGPVLATLADDVRRILRAGAGHDAGDAAGPGRPEPPVDDVVLGNCCGPGGNVARVAALAGGLGRHVPGVTVDRQCGAGLEAVRLGAALVASGQADVVLAGGVESASTSPWRARGAPSSQGPGTPFPRAAFTPDGWPDPGMGEAADALAAAVGITRERQDRYAARSHALAAAALGSGRFVEETVAVAGVDRDDRPRRGLSTEALSRFRPVFSEAGTVTAGNACGINDGAAAVALVPEAVRAAAGVPGLRVVGSAVAGVDPELPGRGPVPAVQAVLGRAGIALADVGDVEIVEAFAAQVLACTDELGLDPFGADADRVCPEGGAIALGHPWGASGALLMVRLFSRMIRAPGRPSPAGRLGLATCAIGGGQGIAVLVERVG